MVLKIVLITYLWYSDKIFIAPSGVQKERIEPNDIFVQDMNGMDIELPPAEKKLTKSQCTPIFMCAYMGKLKNQFFFFFFENNPLKKI